jgi:hypothetical protein
MSDVERAIEAQKSVLNPTDVAMMKQDGELRPDMSVRDYLGKMGVDVDGPVTQLLDALKGQREKANPLNKMQAIARAPSEGQPQQSGRKPMSAGGLDALIDY